MKYLLVLMTLLSSICSAEELKVQYLARQFTVSITLNEISFRNNEMNLSLKKKNCTEEIFKNFTREIKDLTKTGGPSKTQEMVIYTWKNQTYKVSPDQRPGSFLVMLPEEIKRMKIEETIRCSN